MISRNLVRFVQFKKREHPCGVIFTKVSGLSLWQNRAKRLKCSWCDEHAFTNCVHGYERVRNVHAKSAKCTQKIRVRYWFLCVKAIWICECARLFFCPVLGCLLVLFIVSSCSLPCCAALICLFVCFSGSWFCNLGINQTSLSQSEGINSIHVTLQTRKMSLHMFAWFTYKLYQHQLGKNYVFVEKLSYCDKYWLSFVHTYIRLT